MTDTDTDTATITDTALNVTGMDCASCVAHVEKALKSVDGVVAAEVNLARGRATVKFDPGATNPQSLAEAVSQSGYPTQPELSNAGPAAEQERLKRQTREATAWFRRATVGVILWLPLEAAHWLREIFGDAHHAMMPAQQDSMTLIALITSTLAIVYVGGKFYRSAFSALRRSTTNMDVLIAMGASVAYFYSLALLVGGYVGLWTPPNGGRLFFMEATGLLALISLGHWLEARARQSAGSAIRDLLDLTPATARRIEFKPAAPSQFVAVGVVNGPTGRAPVDTNSEKELHLVEVPVADLVKLDEVIVRPGERIPTDGVIVHGASAIDESMITGEPLPVTRTHGEKVIGGTLNREGALRIRVTQIGSETALAQIVKLVETAQSSKPPVQKLADKISAVFVPTVLVIALVTGIAWYAYGVSTGMAREAMWTELANAVCSVLIIACPCALGLAIPAALMVGTGRGAKRGILLRDIDALQKAEHIDTIVLDKTGTVTLGRPQVNRVQPNDGMAEDELLRLAGGVEKFSEHPLAKAIVEFAGTRGISLPNPERFNSDPGFGAIANVDGRTLLVGNARLIEKHRGIGRRAVLGAIDEEQSTKQTLVHIAELQNDMIVPLGVISLTDTIKPDSVAAVKSLQQRGLRTVLLTGDHAAAAEAVGKEVGIDQIHAGVLPTGKADVIRQLQASGRSVAMVGDGINDAPALAQANLGIAIGSGSDIAKETGDIVIVSGSLHGIATAIGLSRATMRVIRQNLFFAVIYNVVAIPLAATGHLTPLIAAAAMALSDVTVLGNALRLRKMKID